ncbi:DUF2845 domain-containing protein [Aquisalimonas asiatica]|uniref:DUF2845 domain-containing protein n=1 Tax=Aquisalimonas asiatica TaxID=406100 RepID=A0A1H8RXA6_9GAMM|nr:DUF2845 domain-containing protein [Aquisalimonas asiatica]SEO70927.1 Protein of unknown function [Aquisalimonas asiatica]
MIRIIVATLALIAVAPAAADFMRCGNDLVQRGDHIAEVHRKCGEPVRTSVLENEYGAAVGKREVYDSAHGSRDHLVTYHGERVVRIERLR